MSETNHEGFGQIKRAQLDANGHWTIRVDEINVLPKVSLPAFNMTTKEDSLLEALGVNDRRGLIRSRASAAFSHVAPPRFHPTVIAGL